MGQADGLVGVSQFVAGSIVAMGYDPARTHVVLNAMDVTEWHPGVRGAAVRQELGIGPDVPVLAVVSRLFHWKGHTDLLRALALVKEREPRFVLLVVGEDDPRIAGGGSYSHELKELTGEPAWRTT